MLISIQDIVGEYTGMKILVGSHLSFNVVRNKLTPRIGEVIPIIKDEMIYSFHKEIPQCQGE